MQNCYKENEITEITSGGYDNTIDGDFPIVDNTNNEVDYESLHLAPYGVHTSPPQQCVGAQMFFHGNASESYVIVNDYLRMANHKDIYNLKEGEVVISDTMTLSFLKFFYNKDIRLLSEADSYYRTKKDSYTEVTGNSKKTVNGTETIEVDKDVSITAKAKVTIAITGDCTVSIDGNCNVHIKGSTNMTVDGSTTIKSPSVTIDAPTTTATGNMAVAGTLTAGGGAVTMSGGGMKTSGSITSDGSVESSGDVKASGISLVNHIHTSVDGGGPTSTPQ